MGIDVNFIDKLIYVNPPQDVVEAQELIDEIRTAEASVSGITHSKIANAAGKESLASGVQVGITLEIYAPWELRFWDGNYVATIRDGNLVGTSGIPIAYSSGVQVLMIQSAAATIVTPEGGDYPSAGEIATEVDVVLSASHGSGNWEGIAGSGASAAEVAEAVWDAQMSAHTASGTAGAFMNFLQDIEGGRWRIVSNQMIFYAEDNATEVARFNLYDEGGNPADSDVYERRRV
jgi:hypothetical protein